jgi:hypothetical protein
MASAEEACEEILAMLAEANLCVENRFQRAHYGDAIIGESPALKEVLRQVEIVASTNARHCSIAWRRGACHTGPHDRLLTPVDYFRHQPPAPRSPLPPATHASLL